MIKNLASSITLEPPLALMGFGEGQIFAGGQIQHDLLLWKICHIEFNYTEAICANLTLDEYDSINDQVQEKANNFLMIQDWLQSVPSLIWCLIAGIGSLISFVSSSSLVILEGRRKDMDDHVHKD